MESSPLHLYAKEYFNSLNSIAERISTDVATTVTAYEDLWHTLSIRDQNQVVNETIIHPEVVLKYSICYPDEKIGHDESLLQLVCGRNLHGENSMGLTCHDEHAGPFCWMTRSQQNLSIFCEKGTYCDSNHESKRNRTQVISSQNNKTLTSENDLFIDPPNVVLGGSSYIFTNAKAKTGTENDNFITKIKNKTVVLKIQSSKLKVNKSDAESTLRKNCVGEKENPAQPNTTSVGSKNIKMPSLKQIPKPKNPPPPPPPSKSKHFEENLLLWDQEKSALLQENSKDKPIASQPKQESLLLSVVDPLEELDDFHVDMHVAIQGAPKTGFDFLDNW